MIYFFSINLTDIATAVSRCEMFDFLIDIVPREETIRDRQPNVYIKLLDIINNT